MIKQITVFLLFFNLLTASAQDFSALWEGYYSYNHIKDVVVGVDRVYAASDNAVFTYDWTTNRMETITTIEGLSGETITAIAYGEANDVLLIGYENGLIEIVSALDNQILSVVDILEKKTIPPNLRRINHFNISGNSVFIATDFGISVYNLNTLEFGDSYYIGNGGGQIQVMQTAIFNNKIYAACGTNNAIKAASFSNTNLIDFKQWETLGSGNFMYVQAVEDHLYVISSSGTISEIIDNNLISIFTYDVIPVDVKAMNGNITVTTKNNVYFYNGAMVALATIPQPSESNTAFTSSIITPEHFYMGTTTQGILRIPQKSSSEWDVIKPDGPLMNNAFKIQADNNNVWMTYGDYTYSYDPSPIRTYGLSHYIDHHWRNTPYDSLLTAQNLNYVSPNPFKPSQVFISSFHKGLLEMNDEMATILWDQTNSPLQSLILPSVPSFVSVRQSGSKFDHNGLLWTMTSRVDKALKSYNPSTKQWREYSFKDIIKNPLEDELGFGDLAIDGNGTKWIGAFYKGLIGYNERGHKIRYLNSEEQNMPDKTVSAVAVDHSNQVWIGTIKGLRVLYNTSNFFEMPNPTVKSIVVLDQGIPQELLSNQYITDIKVDGSNNKWIGTLDAGIFYFSPDGQKTIYHFTTNNSPLPSNTINDISIDPQSGKVYMATQKGLVSFSSGGSKPEAALTSAFAYPNPVRPEYNILGVSNLNDINKGVKIKGITENVNIKITDIEGNLVAEAQSRINLRSSGANYNFAIDGGTAIWNGRNMANHIVASGVYLILISDLDSFETKVIKLLIIR